jgi:hypothetical protein
MDPLCPLESRLGGPQSRSGYDGEEKTLRAPGIETMFSRSPSHTLLTEPRMLSWNSRENTRRDFRSVE